MSAGFDFDTFFPSWQLYNKIARQQIKKDYMSTFHSKHMVTISAFKTYFSSQIYFHLGGLQKQWIANFEFDQLLTIVLCYINLSNLVWKKRFDTIIFRFPGVSSLKNENRVTILHPRRSRGGKSVTRFSIFQTRWLRENGNL